ncbi:hypothetical protein [Chroococcidiopsis cubana]|uniref:hypothetical protein n=1 Tax=Chroococcidiopsis cubana TaxID=171392 RepID=UPI000D07CC52|nr:hypothetical protein [Chroococcidiopsis cubana]
MLLKLRIGRKNPRKLVFNEQATRVGTRSNCDPSNIQTAKTGVVAQIRRVNRTEGDRKVSNVSKIQG